MARSVLDYRGKLKPTWCPGCGDFGVLTGLFNAFARLDLDPNNIALVSGIGCSSRLPGFTSTYGVHSLHGRALPIGQGIKLANPGVEVIVVGGDGDAFAIGGGHFPHAARRNIDLTYVVMNNRIYGLTKGQVAPTSDINFRTVSSPYGNFEEPINPVAFAISVGATFVARGFSGKVDQLTDLMVSAIEHKGFAFLEVISPCVTFNKVHTYKFFQERVTPLPSDYKPDDRTLAIEMAQVMEDKIYTGVFYLKEKPTYQDWLERISGGVEKISPEELLLSQK
ncbi:MAG: 2-oxoacid:ferredoxin oxidoreductase subunit beta [Caldiserica bacterium]|jgi:2-oxoglutarate ferredoxin oxidoreductase subunit beta|nr:2-oxoacid:ferredoxin oxidoreductase subunit beta [Caldisericota bacterium]MDH7562445.1 2-oxoacid:ferredoxin oxidoreductase subunit beta [Caldisericota bacterium]